MFQKSGGLGWDEELREVSPLKTSIITLDNTVKNQLFQGC